MAARTWVFALLLATAVFAAGCTNDAPTPDEDAGATPPPSEGGATPPAPGPAPSQPAARPSDFTLVERGPIEGAFEQTWDIQVANVAFSDAGLRFALEPVQAGAPPTALIHLTLYDPNGAPLKSGTVGLGAPSNTLEWAFSPGQLPQAGTYQLKATNAEQGPLPSGGFATYDLQAHVNY